MIARAVHLFRLRIAATLFAIALPFSSLAALHAQSPFSLRPAADAGKGHVKASLVALDESVQPGRPVTVALKLDHAAHWHTYWLNAGTGYPTSLTWDLPEGWRAGEIQWPVPALIKDREGNITGYGYEGVAYLPVTLTPPASANAPAPGSQVTLKAKADWLMCSDICIPGDAEVSLTLPVANDTPKPAALREKILGSPPMPGQLRGWKISATRAPGAKTIELFLDLESGAQQEANMLTSPYFFSADGLIQYDASQTNNLSLASDSRAFGMGPIHLTLPVSPAYEGKADRLAGILKETNADGSYRGYTIDVPITAAASAQSQTHVPAARATGSGLGLGTLALAFLGGLILNLMPCVFPVLAIKILGFVNQAGSSRRKVTLHGVAFTAGVLASFWILAGALAALRAGGEQLGWGFQLQSPVFVFALAAVMLVFALSLSGVFEFGLGATSAGGKLQDRSGYAGSFFTGVLATVVATPCSAPLLAPALGAALAMPTGESFVTFTFIALGLSTPYLLLSIFPGAIKVLPRPGAWMETFKQLMAFPLYATVAYFVWVLGAQVSESDLLSALLGLVLIAMAAWFYGRYAAPGNSARRRAAGIGAALMLTLLGCWSGCPRAAAPTDIVWEKWSPAAVAQARAEGKTVYVDFTARWCATCQANKKLVFSSGEVLRIFRDKKILTLKADWTNKDAQITAELARFNRSAVPFNLVYKPGAPEPIILPELLTPGIVLDAVK